MLLVNTPTNDKWTVLHKKYLLFIKIQIIEPCYRAPGQDIYNNLKEQ